jgi:hypothetical protein
MTTYQGAVLALYGLLLLTGIVCFVLHFLAQWRIASIMRRRYPDQWRIVAEPDAGKAIALRTYGRFQHVLRSAAPALFDDAELNRWHRTWRLAPRIAWPCWFIAILLQFFAR